MTISKTYCGNVDTTNYDEWLLDERIFSAGDMVILDLGVGMLCDGTGRDRDLVGFVVDYSPGDTHAIIEWEIGEGQRVIGQTPIDSLVGVFN
jgi:hypothetical protein